MGEKRKAEKKGNAISTLARDKRLGEKKKVVPVSFLFLLSEGSGRITEKPIHGRGGEKRIGVLPTCLPRFGRKEAMGRCDHFAKKW